MSFNSVGQYTGTHKAWDHVGNIIPDVESSEGIRAWGDFRPATWLPVAFWEKYYENWIVIMPGKVLAFDNNGRVVPAGLGLSGATISYTSNDILAGTIDVTTGAACNATSVSSSPITLSGVTTFLGGTDTLAISKPVGVASYPILQWAGDGSADDDGTNPAALKYHNYNMQHRVAILMDYVLELPIVPAATSAADLTYSSYASNVVTCAALGNLPVAANTLRTPISFTDGAGAFANAATAFVNQVDTLAKVLATGDWHINLTTGVVSVYAASDPGAGHWHITYSNYASAPTGTSVSVFASVLGDVKPGDFLKCNVDSNLVVATAKTYGDGATDNFDTFADIVGQVLDVEVYPNSLLDKVKTAYSSIGTSATGAYPGYAGQMDQMSGSANGGVSSLIHYAGAANKVCHVNLISR